MNPNPAPSSRQLWLETPSGSGRYSPLPVLLVKADVLELIGEWALAESIYRRAIFEAREGGDPALAIDCSLKLCHLLSNRGAYAQALAEAERAEKAAKGLNDLARTAEAATSMAVALMRQGEYAGSRELGLRAGQIFHSLGSEKGCAGCTICWGLSAAIKATIRWRSSITGRKWKSISGWAISWA